MATFYSTVSLTSSVHSSPSAFLLASGRSLPAPYDDFYTHDYTKTDTFALYSTLPIVENPPQQLPMAQYTQKTSQPIPTPQTVTLQTAITYQVQEQYQALAPQQDQQWYRGA